MSSSFPDQSFIFSLAELQRLLRSYAEKKVSRYGVTRAQWAVLAKLERTEGLPQAKLAKAMEMQPITLKRLIDPLCANGLIERRPDQSDRRAYRLYLKPAGSALVQRLKALRNEINQLALVHLAPAEALRLFSQLEAIKVNVRAALSSECEPGKKERRYGCTLVLKFPGETQASPVQGRKKGVGQWLREKRRLMLLVVLPAIVAVGVSFAMYLSGGRYMSTDNAYVGAQKVLITPDISGKIGRVVVREGQRVEVGDLLFEFDPEPFRLAVQQAEARLATVRTDHTNLQTNEQALGRLIELAQKTVDLKKQDVERKTTLMTNRTGSQFDLDSSNAQLVTAQTQVEQLRQQQAALRNQLLGDENLPLEKFPSYLQAKAALDQARRDLNYTSVRAPMAGNATQVDNIQIGRYVTVGTPVFSIIDDTKPWIDANPKETDFTYVTVGQKATIVVDAFPNHTFNGSVTSLSPGTGAQFAILPPQNASGNWVKVVQRVPIRIAFDADESTSKLRAGMSATVYVDTGQSRTLLGVLGLSAPAQETRP